MKTIILGMLFALSCNYCFAQLKIENSLIDKFVVRFIV